MKTLTKKEKDKLINLLRSKENWILKRLIEYAREKNFTRYTSTLEEAWRISIEGLMSQLIDLLHDHPEVPEIKPDMDFANNPAISFGTKEAKLHRARGITLSMFLGLMKYYRQSFLDSIIEEKLSKKLKIYGSKYINRYFDMIELGFIEEWTQYQKNDIVEELQLKNREMTNEKNKYLTIFESLPNPAIFVNKNRKIENVNYSSAHIFDFPRSPGKIYYASKKVIETPEWLVTELKKLEKNERDEYTTERQVETSLGTRYFHLKMKKMVDVSGKFLGTAVILNDYTEKREAELNLIESEKRYQEAYRTENFYKDLFTHDINNILQNLISATQMMEMHYSDEKLHEKFPKLFQIIKDQVSRGKKLVNNVRKLSKIENKDSFLKINVRDTLNKTIRYLEDNFKDKSIKIDILDGKEQYYVLANDLLFDVFENILLNSVKYNDNEIIEIIINISKEPIDSQNFIRIGFIDNGIGIPDKKKELIFQKGYRTEKKTKGLGFGLSLVKKIIKKYQGKIWVENRVNRDYSKGTKFVLLIPEY
jgi:signal transduction histidine kinase